MAVKRRMDWPLLGSLTGEAGEPKAEPSGTCDGKCPPLLAQKVGRRLFNLGTYGRLLEAVTLKQCL